MATTTELSPHVIQGLCQRYLCQDKKGSTNTDIEKNNFRVLSYKLKPTSDAPVGFLGRHQFLNVEIQITDSEGREKLEKLRFFAKSSPNDVASHMQYIEEFGVFKKEILVYREVLPNLQKIFVDVAPKCYYADNNLLVFENLAEQGYRMEAGRDGLFNYEHLNCVLKNMAAMHAGSIVFEQRMGKKLPELYPEAVVENSYPLDLPEEHVRKQNFRNACEVLKEMIKLMPRYQEKLKFILAEFPKKMATIFELAQVSTKYVNVFSHGDMWANNVMFKYGKFGETPIQCRFVDFQLGRYAPPLMDVMTILTIPTSRQFRAEYMSELLCDYYGFLTEFLKREHLCVEDFMAKQQFYDCAEEYRICGLIESCLFTHLTILPQELTQHLTSSADGFSDFFDRKRVEICLKAFHTDQVYRERLTDVIEDLVDNFVLK